VLPAKSPNLNAFAERWVRSVKEECLAKLILFGERPLLRTLAEFSAHYHSGRNHQGKATSCFFRMSAAKPNRAAPRLSVASDSEACSSFMTAPHEYFDQTGWPARLGCRSRRRRQDELADRIEIRRELGSTSRTTRIDDSVRIQKIRLTNTSKIVFERELNLPHVCSSRRNLAKGRLRCCV